MAKLETSRSAAGSGAGPSTPPPAPAAILASRDNPPRRSSPAKSVHFDTEGPEVIPPREPSEDGEEEQEAPEGDQAVALYDFAADGEDELSVQEGESLLVIERDSAEWWKCRNVHGAEGVVPAQYVEVSSSSCVFRLVLMAFSFSIPERMLSHGRKKTTTPLG